MGATCNFNAGPAMLPPPVLEQVQAELRDYQGRGMSIMEMSHRSAEFEAINSEAETRFKRLLGVGDGYRVLFVQGGASTQFAMVPMNFLSPGSTADYIDAGSWAGKVMVRSAPDCQRPLCQPGGPWCGGRKDAARAAAWAGLAMALAMVVADRLSMTQPKAAISVAVRTLRITSLGMRCFIIVTTRIRRVIVA